MTTRTPARPRVGFFGVLGSGNLGNDGSLDVLVEHMRSRHPEARLGFIGMGPERLEERYGTPATPLQWYEAHRDRLSFLPDPLLKIVGRLLDPVRSLRWVRGFDLVVVPGMGVLEATTPLRPWGFPWGLFWACATARIAGRRVALVCVGADRIRDPLSRWLITRSARLAHYRSFRDEHSRQAMRAMGVDVSGDDVYPDLAFVHAVPDSAPDGTGSVGLGVMAYRGNSDERQEADALHRTYVDVLTRFALWLLDKGRPVHLHACDPEDATPIAEIVAELRVQRPDLDPDMVTSGPVATLQDLMDRLATVDTVVATRYHNVITAVRMSIPTVSISYAAKHDDVMRRAGLSEFCQPARSVDFERLVAQFTELEARRDEIVPALREHNRANVEGVERQLAAFSALVTGAGPAPAGLHERVPEPTER